MDCRIPGSSVFHCLLEFAQTHVHGVADSIHPSHPVSSSSPAAVFPSITDFSNESALCIRWPKYWSFSFQWISRVDFLYVWLLWSPCCPRPPKSLLKHHSLKASILCAQPSSCTNSHILTWLLEKPELWLYRSLLAKWCLCFLIHSLGFS